MNSRQRVLAALDFRQPDRAPFNFWMDRRLMAEYEREFGEDWRVTAFDADVVETFLSLPFPCGESVEESGTGWIVEPLLKSLDEIDDLQFPDPHRDEVYAQIERDLAKFPDRAIFLDVPGVLTVAHGMREYSNILMDVYDSPGRLKELFERISDIQAEAAARACEMGITALYVMDDLACKNGLLMSLPMLQEFVFPYNQKIINAGKTAGLPVLMHCCGKVTEVIDSFIEQGIDALNPLQTHLHDFREFKEMYHGILAVYGALDNTYIIPDGTPDEVRAHVREVFEVLGEGGGLIFSTHDIPLGTPRENVEAMIEEIRNCGY
ncbi:MAG: hypothetical protein NTU88_05605 [Armatimonadetes bacterium]|nr:hypothetical protein [Armatimonadota bacterium]